MTGFSDVMLCEALLGAETILYFLAELNDK